MSIKEILEKIRSIQLVILNHPENENNEMVGVLISLEEFYESLLNYENNKRV